MLIASVEKPATPATGQLHSVAVASESMCKPAMQSDDNAEEASAPCSLWRMLSATSAAKPASESLQASSTACSSTLAAPSMSFASSAAKPAEGQLHSVTVASESMSLTLTDALSMLTKRSWNVDAQQLIQDIPVLQRWQRTTNPNNKVRDAMLKLGSHWSVPRNAKGKKRSPSEVAQDMEESMLKRASLVLSSSVSKPATQGDNNQEEKSSAISVEKPATQGDINPAALPMQETSASATSAGKPVTNQGAFRRWRFTTWPSFLQIAAASDG